MKNVRLLVFDVDGTLSIGQSAIDNDVSQKLCEFEAQGFQICLASGKDLYYLKALARGMGLQSTWFIAENGAVCYENSNKITLVNDQKILSELIEIRKQIASRYPTIDFQPNEANITAFFSSPIRSSEVCNFIQSIETWNSERLKLYVHPASIDISPKKIDKASALQYIVERNGFGDSEIVVVGDGPNDEALILASKYRLIVGNDMQWLPNVMRFKTTVDMLQYLEKELNPL